MYKARKLEEIQQFMEQSGVPGSENLNLPASGKSFPYGCHYRIEIAGVERYSTMAAMIEEAKNERSRSTGLFAL